MIFLVGVLLRSCDRRLSVIVTNVSITSAEIISRVDSTIVVYPSVRTDSSPPLRGKFKQLWALVSFPIILVSPISIPIEELQELSKF